MFNNSQREAINFLDGAAMVLAGPGSGKTTVITHRVKSMIEAGVRPEEVLVVTFTKAAATDMQKRFNDLMNEADGLSNYNVTFGTFHSVYFKILKCCYNYGVDSIVSEGQKNAYIKEIIIRLKIDTSVINELALNLTNEISRYKGSGLDLDSYSPMTCSKDNFQNIYKEYQKTLYVENKIDYDDMLLKTKEELEVNQRLLSMWQERYKYILIDEFQDINMVQYEIIKRIAMPENNIFIVGDDDQSIYGFRGSKPEIMFQFEKDYKDARKIYLNTNYRSTPQIVNCSLSVIGNNENRFTKKLLSHNDNGNRPEIKLFKNELEEFKHMAELIKHYLANGIKIDEIAILVRNNSQIPIISEYLANNQIGVKQSKTKKYIYSTMVAKDVLSYIRASMSYDESNIADNEDLMNIINKPIRFIGRQAIFDEKSIGNLRKVYSHNRTIINSIDDLEFSMKMIKGLSPTAALTFIRFGAGYENYLRQYAIDKNININKLLKQLDDILRDCAGFKSINEWLSYIEKDDEKEEKKGINIITMHSSKGLEFKVVFIPDANQGVIPNSRSVRDKDFEEERRLFYVAMTRAKMYLHIYCVKQRLGCDSQVSMFVREAIDSPIANCG